MTPSSFSSYSERRDNSKRPCLPAGSEGSLFETELCAESGAVGGSRPPFFSGAACFALCFQGSAPKKVVSRLLLIRGDPSHSLTVFQARLSFLLNSPMTASVELAWEAAERGLSSHPQSWAVPRRGLPLGWGRRDTPGYLFFHPR